MVKKILIFLFFIFISNANATPCDFKGINVGDKMSPKEIMDKLGVSKYKINPKRPELIEMQPLIDKHGFISASEIIDWNLGPYCAYDSCRIPGVHIGIDIPSSVFVSFNPKSYQIQAIDVAINASNWDDLIEIIKRKYGENWKNENSVIRISNRETKTAMNLDRQSLIHASGGVNSKTKDHCAISAIQYDRIYTHADPLGLYHSVFEIKLISDNF